MKRRAFRFRHEERERARSDVPQPDTGGQKEHDTQ